jgi:hypothetical protein
MIDLLSAAAKPPTTGLTVRLRLVSANSGRPLAGLPVRLSQCTLSQCTRNAHETGDQTHLTDNAGWAEFGAGFPDAHTGHWPHLHVETPAGPASLGLPADACAEAYTPKPERADLAAAFRDGRVIAMASVTGDAHRGFVATHLIKLTPVRG